MSAALVAASLAVAVPAGSHTGALAVPRAPRPTRRRCPPRAARCRWTRRVRERRAPARAQPADGRLRPAPDRQRRPQAYIARSNPAARVPGAEVRDDPVRVRRLARGSESLQAGGEAIPLAGPVPYAKPTPAGGVSGELVFIPKGTAITAENAAGKIVVRDAATTSVPKAAFAALEWWSYDPDLLLTKSIGENYERDYLAYLERDRRPRGGGGRAGAAGVVLVHGFPREQVRDHYAPYEGVHWGVPGRAGGRGRGRAAEGSSPRPARRDSAARHARPAPTRTLVATLPGMSEERIVVQSHTDGMNAVWDNGPPAMLAMAEHLAALPKECRPRTIEFVFTTAHLYQRLMPPEREGGAGQYAKELDKGYDDGTVALVLALEHLGALEYDAVPRGGGLPGPRARADRRAEPISFFVGESPALVERPRRGDDPPRHARHDRAARRRPAGRADPAAPGLRRRGHAVPAAPDPERLARHRAVDALQPGVRDGGGRPRR